MTLHARYRQALSAALLHIAAASLVYCAEPRQIASSAFPSVVVLMMQDSNSQPISLGSGFFVAKDTVATNRHVVEGASSGYAKVIGKEAKYGIAGVVAQDPEHDLVLLKIESVVGIPIPLGDDAKVGVGDQLYAVGNPQGLEGTFSSGIVSGIRQNEIGKLLQITAPISPGSSGGPVLNSTGEVIGVAVGTFRGGQNLNFAIPSSYLRPMISESKNASPLSSLKRKSASGTATDLGDEVTSGVVVVGAKWKYAKDVYSGYPSTYVFSFRNRLREAIKNIYFVVIFYGDDGEPVDSTVGMYGGPILPGLAKLLDTDPLTGNQPGMYPGHSVRDSSNRFEVRVLDFSLVEEGG